PPRSPGCAAAPPARRAPACPGAAAEPVPSRPAREPREVRGTLLQVGVAPLLGLLADVVEEGGVPGELLDARQPVGVGVEARLEQAQRHRAHLEDAPADLE